MSLPSKISSMNNVSKLLQGEIRESQDISSLLDTSTTSSFSCTQLGYPHFPLESPPETDPSPEATSSTVVSDAGLRVEEEEEDEGDEQEEQREAVADVEEEFEATEPRRECVLVTGGAGYVGSHCVVKLLEQRFGVVVVDNLSNAYRDENVLTPESLIRAQVIAGRRIHFYEVDLNDEAALSRVFDKHQVDCVMHFAALKSVSESCSKPWEYYRNNINGALTLIKVMTSHGVGALIYSSSCTVYGTPQALPLTEDHPTGQGMTNPYGKTKYMVEEIFKDVCSSSPDWKVGSLRYFNPVGAHPSGKMGEDPLQTPNNLMPFIAQVAIGRLPLLYVYGDDYPTKDGTGVRDYIHVEDLAEGHIAAIEKLLSQDYNGFRAFNLGTGQGHTVLEVVKAFASAAQRDIHYKIVERRAGDIAEAYCDTTLAQKELKWCAKRNLNEMCYDMWKWQVKNPFGYKKVKK